MIAITFTWPAGAEETPPLRLTMPRSALEERDPDGASLVAAKMRFVDKAEFEMDASGPGADEYMTPELIRFVWGYMDHGSLDVTPGLEGDDAQRCAGLPQKTHRLPLTHSWKRSALEYFGLMRRSRSRRTRAAWASASRIRAGARRWRSSTALPVRICNPSMPHSLTDSSTLAGQGACLRRVHQAEPAGARRRRCWSALPSRRDSFLSGPTWLPQRPADRFVLEGRDGRHGQARRDFRVSPSSRRRRCGSDKSHGSACQRACPSRPSGA